MKLYYKPGACSLATHIVLREIGNDFEYESVDTDIQKTETGDDFTKINSKGYVPVLSLENGQKLTEGAAILQYLADQHPETDFAPKPGTLERARLQEHLNFVSSELHKAFGPLFTADATDEEKIVAKKNVAKKMDHIETLLSDGRKYLLGDKFSVADAYLFVVTNWANPTGIELNKWANISAFHARVVGREKVQDAMRAEGLLN